MVLVKLLLSLYLKFIFRSVDWKCEHCGNLKTILKPVTEASKAANEEAKELASQINFRVNIIWINIWVGRILKKIDSNFLLTK